MEKNKWCEKCLKKGKKIKATSFIYHKNRIESLCIDCYMTDEKKEVII